MKKDIDAGFSDNKDIIVRGGGEGHRFEQGSGTTARFSQYDVDDYKGGGGVAPKLTFGGGEGN